MKKIKLIIGWISLVLILIFIIGSIVYRFMNPDLTETRLFLKFSFGIFLLIISIVGLEWGFDL